MVLVLISLYTCQDSILGNQTCTSVSNTSEVKNQPNKTLNFKRYLDNLYFHCMPDRANGSLNLPSFFYTDEVAPDNIGSRLPSF